MRQTQLFGALGGVQRGNDQRLARDFGNFLGLRQPGVLIHHAHHQILIQAAPIHTDAHRLVVLPGDRDHHRELVFALAVLAHVAGIDAVFRQRLRALRELGQQAVSVVVKVADQRHIAAHRIQHLADTRHLNGSFGSIHRDANQFGTGLRQLEYLARRTFGIDGVGVGHGLHDDMGIAADCNIANKHALRRTTRDRKMTHLIPPSSAQHPSRRMPKDRSLCP